MEIIPEFYTSPLPPCLNGQGKLAEPPAIFCMGQHDLILLLGDLPFLHQFPSFVFHIVLIGADDIEPDLVLSLGDQLKGIRPQIGDIAAPGAVRKGQLPLIVGKMGIAQGGAVLQFSDREVELLQIIGCEQAQHGGFIVLPGGDGAVAHTEAIVIFLHRHRVILGAAKAIGIQRKLLISCVGLPVEGLLLFCEEIGRFAVCLRHQFQSGGSLRGHRVLLQLGLGRGRLRAAVRRGILPGTAGHRKSQQDTAEQKTESAAEESSAESTASGNDNKDSSGSGENHTEQSTENTTENSTEDTTEETQPTAKCTCKEKCSQYAVDEDCEVCAKDYKECAYINPSVKITINTPSGWHNDTTKVTVKVEDTIVSGNFTIQTVKAKVGQNGSWTDITEDMYIEISENSTIYVQVTDQKGKTYEKKRYIKCFDFTKPTLNAAVSDGLLSIQAHDTDSGIKAIYVNGYEFTEHTNGALNIRLQQFDAGYQYFTISAMDNAGNTSEIYKTANPYYTDPENKDSNEKDPAQQLPVDASATKPSSATAQVTEHTKTDVNGNTVSQTGSGTTSSSSATTKQSPSAGDTSKDADQSSDSQTSEKGKEFYTIQTASEKVFYLVIDRDGEDEKVYFLTEVSENDLLNTTTDNSETLPKNSAALESAIPTKDSALSNNNADTTGDKTQGAESVEDSTEDSTEDTSEPKENTAKADGSGFTYILMGIAAVAVIGVVYVVKSKKKKENFIDEDEDEDELDEDYDYDDEEETEQDSDEAFINGGDDAESVDTDENDNEDNNNENDEEDGEE